jgi:peptidoglycan hydrolase-like protein with peptidoglycan-binding domain
MRRKHCVTVTRASAASIIASLALLCVPTLGLAAEPGDSPAQAADATGATLSVGAGYGQPRGELRVRALQRRLRALGHRPGPVDGLYGPRTKAAVEHLQREGGLSVDGIAGPQTRRLLNPDAPPLAPGAGYGQRGGSPQVRELQRRLRAQRSGPGPVDGIYGPRTEAAVERFQRSAGEPATGVLSRATAVALARTGSTPATRTSETPGSDKPQRAAEPSAGGSEPSTTRPSTVADSRTDAGEEAGSTLQVPLVALTLALAATGGLLALWLTRRRPRPDLSRTPAGPVRPAPTPNGKGKPAYHGNRATGNGQAATPGNGSRRPSTRESPRPRDGAVALGYVSARESAATDDGPALRDQVGTIDAACRERGLVLSDVIRDLDPVEDPGPERPGMQHALERLAAREASCLVVADLGRLSRSAPELGHIVGWLRRHETRLVAVGEGLDTDTKSGGEAADELVSVGAAAGQRRTSTGKRQRDPAPGKPPPRSASRSSRPARPDALELRERIRAMRASGMTLQAIADRLNAENVPTLRGGTKWRPSAIQQAVGYRRPPPGRSDRRPTSSRKGGGHQ